jgi:hypothetical protein
MPFAGAVGLQQPQCAWVTPKGIPDCTENNRALGSGWRPATAGRPTQREDYGTNSTLVLCAGLIDMQGLGSQWVAGGTITRYASCNIKCPNNSCYEPAPRTSFPYSAVTAGIVIHKSDKGHLVFAESPFTMKCACVHCADRDALCENALWVKAAQSSSCAQPTIQAETGETFPSAVYSQICRNDESSNFTGNTGWVDAAVSPSVCRGLGWNATNYSVWCPARLG